MNRQPFYYFVEVDVYRKITEDEVERLKSIEGILPESIDILGNEVMFTATREIQEDELPFSVEFIDYEPGDPSDLC